ncbi:spore coat associated protein CotJA [Brevibacillus fluminis]|uniref:Spore coat associated protein CotJA n=1 Tax=Brevibacillus fluminis TaxID=511487 RepID=A0A3M8CVE5_9BACL|nr:spore coat associated protein CotJA [Brevibacillus fluminis]RNB79714.1 spore coat associated protein CotJA [Brevibacillus fluminis]
MQSQERVSQERVWFPFVGPYDPCPPERIKSYVIPPNLTMGFQPCGLPQYSTMEALSVGTLWPAFYSPYRSNRGRGRVTT